MLKTGFIGAGTTGTALAVRLSQKGWPVVAVSSRTLSSAQRLAKRVRNCQVCHTTQELADVAELVFITTPDDVIAQVCSEVHWHKGQSVLHCSGAHSVDRTERPALQRCSFRRYSGTGKEARRGSWLFSSFADFCRR